MKIVNKIKTFVAKTKLKKRNVFISRNSQFEEANFESYIKIGSNCNIKKSKIGFGTYIADCSILPYADIGRYCSISRNVTIAIGDHPTTEFVSTHPSFYSTLNQAGFYFVEKSIFDELKYAKNGCLVKIGNDVWIGTNVTILSGVTIGDGAIIGAGAVVTKDIEPYTINVGVPAKTIKKRFIEEDIRFLLDLKWWNEDFEWIKEYAKYFSDMKLLKTTIRK